MELIDGLLFGTLDHRRDISLIRVAWREGAFWSADNRRLFCFKHCQLNRICVKVCRWEGSAGDPIDESEVTLFFGETAQKLHDQQWKQLANRRTTEITIEHQLVEHIGAEWAYEAQLP